MPTEILQVDYRHILLDDEPSAAAAVLERLSRKNLALLAFSQFPHGPGKSQLVLIAQDCDGLTAAVEGLGLPVSSRKIGFLIRGDSDPETAVPEVLNKLAAQHIGVTAMQAISAGAGRFGALLWVRTQDIAAASQALGATAYLHDMVDESSEESFPASDPPSFATPTPEISPVGK